MPNKLRPWGFYQEIAQSLVEGAHSSWIIEQWGNRLEAVAQEAYALRRIPELQQVSRLLLALPDPHATIGRYYYALCLKRLGNPEASFRQFEKVSNGTAGAYHARALASAGAVAFDTGDHSLARSLFLEALRAAISKAQWEPQTAITARRMLAVHQSLDGDHRGSLANLTGMMPFVLSIAVSQPYLLFEHQNSLAVELMKVGRLEEAAYASKVALASPYASAYPEWQETGRDIRRCARRTSKSVAAVAINRRVKRDFADNTGVLPQSSTSSQQTENILFFPSRQIQPSGKGAAGSTLTRRIRTQSEVASLVARSSRFCPEISGSASVTDPVQRPSRQIDLETPSSLEEIITLWINCGIAPEQFAAVMSSLRDCDDDLRRKNILDRMITLAFRETSQSIESEDRWRERVEARLQATIQSDSLDE
jgi:tetratricopeptide (TPR) repeat protein